MYDPNYVHVLTEEEQKDLHRRERDLEIVAARIHSVPCRAKEISVFSNVVQSSWNGDSQSASDILSP